MGSIGFIGDMGFIPDIGSIGNCFVKLPALPMELPYRLIHCGNDRSNPAVGGYEFRRDDMLSMLPVSVRIKRENAWRRSTGL